MGTKRIKDDRLILLNGDREVTPEEVLERGGPSARTWAIALMKPTDLIEVEDVDGNRSWVTVAHWRRWPSVRETFRPVAETPDTPVSIEPPTGDKPEEN